MSDRPLTVDDLVSTAAAEQLGPGIIPTQALLVVETMATDGPGLRFVRCEGLSAWHALGMLRSVVLRIEDEDRDAWIDWEDDEDA